MDIILIILGLAILVLGAEFLVRGASGIASVLRIPPIIIGLTVVAFGTSAPELAVGIRAGISSNPEIVIGNVIGSNIYNILLILGISAIIVPLNVTRKIVAVDAPIMVCASLAIWFMALNGYLGKMEGIFLFAAFLIYMGFTVFKARSPEAKNNLSISEIKPEERRSKSLPMLLLAALVVLGLILLALGARWLVDGASSLAETLGVSEMVIGLTIVAAGTSLPETATSIVAGISGERDIAVGNVIGSNIFNIMVVLSMSIIISANPVRINPSSVYFDIPFMVMAALACVPIFFSGGKISRGEGMLLLASYFIYIGFLI